MSSDLFDLSGKVGLVTGGNQGLGFGFASGIAKCGADVVIWGRRAEKNEEAAAALRSHGVRVFTQAVDVSDERRVVEAMAEAAAEMGRIDCVVANAGISSRPPSFHEMPSEMYHDLLAPSQHGVFYTLREAVKHMVARAEAGDPGGSLIVCGSLTVLRGVPRLEHYGAAKGAALAMMRGVAVEYGGYGIRANMVAAGYFDTGLKRDPGVAEARSEQMRLHNPIPRVGYPSDVEGITAYLMSDASRYHTGDLIVIDGGSSIAM
jgi:NAD(P)-dependent dehydrogenase (short-subunit alcohol dehydrogenase family)